MEIRSGYNCAEPLAQFLGSGPVARVSFYIYNTVDEIDRLIEGLQKVKAIFHLNSKHEILNPKQIQNKKSSNVQNRYLDFRV